MMKKKIEEERPFAAAFLIYGLGDSVAGADG